MEGLLRRSLENKEKIIIFYVSNKNQITERYIRVLQLHDDYVTAYCYYRKQVRTFKLESILSAGQSRKRVGA
ncbi:hypothetical protein ACFSMW_00020 [Virgibacillus halophilus]|uniref:WYL domain-containing protein n=1 Tax=Tigheibacillus halophilus TaxID=361280 RepID=A0ABU5C9C6_9BACI|nr:hypothetical protein [Virgibacillus halophilus]